MRKILEDAANLKYFSLCSKCREGPSKAEEGCQEARKEEETMGEDCLESKVKFFRRASPTKPFEFDYDKIFSTSFLNDCGAVRNSINTALDVEKHSTVDNAITTCLRDVWQSELNAWNEKRQAEMDEKRQRVVANCDEIGKNKRKILNLLPKAISLMRKNAKFVLATLPDAHRLPILREWILFRFGVCYDDEHNEARWKINKGQRAKLEQARLVPLTQIPSYKFFGIESVSMTLDEVAKKRKMVSRIEASAISRKFS